jgi:tryptophanyl-tRNA synthetase
MGPGIANLLSIAQACDPSFTKDAAAGMRYGDFKKRVAEILISRLEPIQERYRRVMADPSYIDSVLAEGRARVRPVAEETVRRAKVAMGLYA